MDTMYIDLHRKIVELADEVEHAYEGSKYWMDECDRLLAENRMLKARLAEKESVGDVD